MYAPKTRKFLLIFLIVAWAGTIIFINSRKPLKACFFPQKNASAITVNSQKTTALLNEVLLLLTYRKDNQCLALSEEILSIDPDNLDALWAKAEILRRQYKFRESENLLNKILKASPYHAPSLITLAYIRYHDDKLNDSLKIVNTILKNCPDREDQALAHLMLGIINSKRTTKGWLLSKIQYGMQIKRNFDKAAQLAPEIPDVHLGLGTFFLKAPGFAGGDINKAIDELNIALEMAPDFATANARIAQAYKKKGNLEKYNFYISRAKELDPDNEVLQEALQEKGNEKP